MPIWQFQAQFCFKYRTLSMNVIFLFHLMIVFYQTLHPLLEDGCQGDETPEPHMKVLVYELLIK